MLQGPMGPFFKRLDLDLEILGHSLYKINLKGLPPIRWVDPILFAAAGR